MEGEVLTLPQLGEGIFIWGWKSSRWKQLAMKFGHKFAVRKCRPDGLAVSPPGPDFRPDYPAACQNILVLHRTTSQSTSSLSAGLVRSTTGWSGLGPDLGPN
jgi:hypothetical protein